MMDEIADFMRKTDSALIVGRRQMYFEGGEWVVATAPPYGSKQQIEQRFSDTVPSGLSAALALLAVGEPW